MHDLTQQLLIALQLGSIYALIALGYTMVYGVLKLINFAHGDVYMVGAYGGIGAAWLLGTWLPRVVHLPALIPSPVGAVLVLLGTMAVCGLLGLIIEQAAYRPLRSRAWVAPAIFLGAACGYLGYSIAANSNRTPVSAALIGLAAWGALAALLYTTQRRRATTKSSRLTALITAIGISLFLENFGGLPQVFSQNPQFYPDTTRSAMPLASMEHKPIVYLSHGVETGLIFGISLTLMLVLTYIVTRTRIGKAIRAVSYDADAAALMGINTDQVIAFTFALGAALAGAAGVLVFGLQHTKFDPYVGISYGLKAFVAAVLGGIGNIPGAVLGGLIMGLAETLVVAYGPLVGVDSTYRDAVAFLLLIIILLFKPAGLLGTFAPEKV